jgi:hypothetical protein
MKKAKLNYTPFHFPGRVQIATHDFFGVGVTVVVRKNAARKSISLHLPFITVVFYLESMSTAHKRYELHFQAENKYRYEPDQD